MNLSALAVSARPEHLADVTAAIETRPWAEVHHSDGAGRMIVVIEGADTDEEIGRLYELKRLPHVLSAELVLHCFDEEPVAARPEPAGRIADLLNEDGAAVPRSYFRQLKRLGNH